MTNLNLETRETKLTKAEFDSLPRNADGDIIGDLQMIQIFMTPEQHGMVSSDDWSRIAEYQDEMEYEAAQFMKEVW